MWSRSTPRRIAKRIPKRSSQPAVPTIRRPTATGSRETVWDKVERIAKVLQNVAIIFGIVVGLPAFLLTQSEKRASALEPFRAEYVKDVRKPYLDFVERWGADKDAAKILTASQADGKKILLDFSSQPPNQAAISAFAEFFDGVWLCVRAGTCDQNTAIDLFGEQAGNVYQVSGYYIAARRVHDRDATFGVGLERMFRLRHQSYLARLLMLP